MAEPTPPVPTLYLIRHGETDWTLTGQHTGRTDLPLTPRGEAQAASLAAWLAGIDFTHVLTSPRQRARRTCELAGLAAAAAVTPDLAEWDYGEYEGLRSSDITASRPGWDVFRDGCPGGEMPGDVAARADRLIAQLAPLAGNIALFSHGGFGGALVTRWIGLPIAHGPHFALSTASMSILGHNPTHPNIRAITLWNAVPAVLGR